MGVVWGCRETLVIVDLYDFAFRTFSAIFHGRETSGKSHCPSEKNDRTGRRAQGSQGEPSSHVKVAGTANLSLVRHRRVRLSIKDGMRRWAVARRSTSGSVRLDLADPANRCVKSTAAFPILRKAAIIIVHIHRQPLFVSWQVLRSRPGFAFALHKAVATAASLIPSVSATWRFDLPPRSRGKRPWTAGAAAWQLCDATPWPDRSIRRAQRGLRRI